MKALIVDDERLGRAELRRLLEPHPEVEIVGEARDADEALAQIEQLQPDLLFLDIQMPGRSGFELLEQLDRVPLVIFTTAYDEYALRAFEVNALDYLLKPVSPERLDAALARAALRKAKPAMTTASASSCIFVKDGERCWFVTLSDVVLLASEGNYARLYLGGNRPPKAITRGFTSAATGRWCCARSTIWKSGSIRPSFSAPPASTSSTCDSSKPSTPGPTAGSWCG